MTWLADVVTRTTIRSVWGNGVRDRIVQTFDSFGEANAHLSLPDGALMTVPTGSNQVYAKWSGAWRPIGPAVAVGALVTLFPAGGLAPGATWTYAAADVPAGFQSGTVAYTALVSPSDGTTAAGVEVKLFTASGGTQVGVFEFNVPGRGGTITATRAVALNINGDRIIANVSNVAGGAPLNLFRDNQNHALAVVAYPTPVTATPPFV